MTNNNNTNSNSSSGEYLRPGAVESVTTDLNTTRSVRTQASALKGTGGDIRSLHRMRTTPGREARRERRRQQRQAKKRR